MNLDRDLREALAPLAGDPAADAARVMASLPPLPAAPLPDGQDASPESPRQPRRRQPVPDKSSGWPLSFVAAAVLGGLAIGVVAGVWWEASHVPQVAAPGPEKEKDGEQKDEPKKEEPKPPVMPTREQDLMMLMAFAPLEIDEPGVGVQQLEPGGFATRLGTVVRTGEGGAGLYVYANDARVRLDHQSAAMVDLDKVELDAGRVWLSTLTRPAPFEIRAGAVRIESKAVEVQVQRLGAEVDVLCLQGALQVRSGEGPARGVEAMQRVSVSADGTIAAPEPIGFAGAVTAWMVPMVKQQQDETELNHRIAMMVEEFQKGTYRPEAALELRRFGSRAVPYVYKAMVHRGVPDDEQRQAAELIGSIAEYSQVPWLFALLENDAPEVRVAAFRALVRVGAPRVDDEAFWREAPASERERSLARWRALVR
ncbi:MAG: HEAT repeat domain-containing protein [Planctomycetes bacterium]|nr:HEAT repeat domain-containing protein [Planctomycetota bacterium]MCB9886746.1 HEAT repeat domain-containing protein [Planctomycetota bacterium]